MQTQADVDAAAKTAADVEARKAERAAQVLQTSVAVSITHPDLEKYGGVYRLHSVESGWPVLKNDKHAFCFRCAKEENWLLNDSYTPESGDCVAYVAAPLGPLPVGAHSWWYYPAVEGSDWEERTVTVALLVRTPPFLC